MKNVEIPKWLERLPMAPEFHPTDTEFADPIAYISKIEKEASAFGICKVIPPLPKPSRKYVLHNLNKSLSKCPELDLDVNLVTPSKTDSVARNNCDRTVNAGERGAVFTTRHQQLGCEKGRKVKGAVGDQVCGAQKQVWQSGEVYTLDQFEAKAKTFAKTQLGIVKEVNPLVIETMFWKAASEKPVYVEYANDVPGSGFSEPEGLLRYFDRRRRRRRKRNSFDRNNVGNSDSKNDQVDSVNSISNNNEAAMQISTSSCTETTLNSLPSHQSHHHASFSGRKDSEESSEMEGTAGWKLSNSPWNLQVIARSPGSLTRFMPDDIPGVTSPMVYIGMLFSWFAWHVEDHELHSLNFLHMGSPKTWYAVPGDYAFNFEEAIRCHAYGGNSDRLVALSLLGEKTTVLSPEIIAASGIPCCRLVQYPGEFVVTFPRAYHIGFSHGFNCGEAANFGTSKWLTIAKEAAVRRAAMNYLPMLSHQQLLHLLTMSFISRIPRSLLPGVRSSRLRDRLKEERELSVKRAFIEDILHENTRVAVLLQRNPPFHAVLWDVDSLPSSSKESDLCKNGDALVLASVGEDSPKNDVNLHDVDQLSNYISAGGFDFDDDDLAYDFQIESGTLPCVACGILGFPFMAVVQPSETASINLMDLDSMVEASAKDKAKVNRKDLSHGNRASLGGEKSQSTHSSMEQSPNPDCSVSLNHQAVSPTVNFAKGWKFSNASFKPRIFCLEHAIEIEELLRSRGGANILVICHSDFQKIKTHAAVIAEEIAVPFRYTEIPLGDASLEDLNLIDIAIDREDHATSAEDWTSLLNINLQHCMKVKRSSPSLNVEHLLSLGGLFSDATPVPNTSSVKWLARKFRSKRLSKRVLQNNPSVPNEIVKDDGMAKKDVKLIQYSRKRFKACSSSEIRAPVETNDLVIHGILDTNPEDPDKEDKTENNGKTFSAPSELPFDGNSEIQCEHVETSFESHSANPVIDSLLIENVVSQTRIRPEKDEVVGSCSDDTLREEETENEAADVAGKGSDLSAENDCAIKEASTDDSSNCSDDDEQMETMSDQSNSDESKSSSSEGEQHIQTDGDDDDNDGRTVISQENKVSDDNSTIEQSKSTAKTGNKRKREVSLQLEDQLHFSGFIRGPCEGLRPRARQVPSGRITEDKAPVEDEPTVKKSRKAADNPVPRKDKKQNQKGRYKCEIEGCTMNFRTKAELQLHEGNRCPVEGCRKKFNSHKYALLHQRVHDDDRPLKCPWDGCTMSFKWAWARTEHLRVHTGERPYLCKVKGCGLTFRFVSDFSRHRRKTGHYVSPPAK